MTRAPADRIPLGRHNPRVARLRRIVRREEPALTVLDGVRLLADLAPRGVEVLEVYTTSAELERLDRIPGLGAVARRGDVFVLEEATLQGVAPTRSSQGLLAVVPVRSRPLGASGVTVYLERVQDPGNVGSVIRSAAAFGASGVACSPGCADPFSPRALRASAGHALLLPVAVEAGFATLAAGCRRAGGAVLGTRGTGEQRLPSWSPGLPLLLAFGNEGEGLSEAVLQECEGSVSVAYPGAVESLNVAVAAGIILAALLGVAPSPILEWKRGRQ